MRLELAGGLAFLALAIAGPLAAQDAASVVARHNAAYSAGDFDAFMQTFAEDAVVVADGRELQGREAIASSYSDNFAPQAPRVQIERQGRAAGGGIVQVESLVMVDGRQICCTVSAIFVRDGEIARIVIDTSNPGG